MNTLETKKLTIGISSMALFDLVESNKIFETEGKEAYCEYQIAREDESLSPGVAYPLVKKLLGLNKRSPKELVEVILLSRNSADTGLRVFNSIREHELDIKRAAFTSGQTPFAYISAFNVDLFLSTSPDDVRKALEAGHAAATILSGKGSDAENEQLRIAFDGDAVIFSDESERIYKEKGLDAFTENEQQSAKQPMSGGPFKPFLAALHGLQSQFGEEESPVRTALVTARSAPAHERVVRTLRSWGIRIDEALFLGGLQKGEFLKSFGADIFFDDQATHIESANEHVATGHVPHGVANED
ncbi:MAG: 5'-nucleotidase [Cycloclasticus sp. symbiont of Bathymodiolus heckerae]|nr:MAG: 5'-nucleotidase [Cycloclasticus sp. symbiont of Bathymodiolus heckerae]